MKDFNPGSFFFLFIFLAMMGVPVPFMIFAFVAFVIFRTAASNQQQDQQNQRNRRGQNRRQRDYRRPQSEYQRAPRRDYQRPASRPTPKPKKNPFKKSGIEKYKDYDYEGAITDFEKALQINPKDVAVHFNLACAYSLTEEKEKAFEHLDKAVALGFSDFEKIKTHDALAFLRIQDEFESFEKNNYRRVQGKSTSTNNGATSVADNQNLLEQLKKLAELREQGLLTEEEFVMQKKRLLN